MRYDLVATYANGGLELISAAAGIHQQHQAQVLLSEGGRHTYIESVETPLTDEELGQAATAQPEKRFYWVNPFDEGSVDPELIGKVFAYYSAKLFGFHTTAGVVKRSLGVDRYDLTLRLANYTKLNGEQVDAIRRGMIEVGGCSHATIEPA